MSNVFTSRLLQSRDSDLASAEQKLLASQRTEKLYNSLAELAEVNGLATDARLLPKRLHCNGKPRSGLYQSDGSLSYEGAKPDLVLLLLALLPPVPVVDATDGTFRAFIPTWDEATIAKYAGRPKSSAREVYGAMLSANRMPSYDSKITVKWFAELDGLQLEISAQLENIQGVTPDVKYKAETYPGTGKVRRITFSELSVPVGDELLRSTSTERRFAAGGEEYIPDRLLVNTNPTAFQGWLQAMADELVARKNDAMARYQVAVDEGLLADYQPSDRSRGMNAGTVEQDACLQTVEARRDRYLAEHHWPLWVEANNPEVGNMPVPTYFTYFVWASHWLSKHNLLVADYEGTPYKYGTAWLPA